MGPMFTDQQLIGMSLRAMPQQQGIPQRRPTQLPQQQQFRPGAYNPGGMTSQAPGGYNYSAPMGAYNPGGFTQQNQQPAYNPIMQGLGGNAGGFTAPRQMQYNPMLSQAAYNAGGFTSQAPNVSQPKTFQANVTSITPSSYKAPTFGGYNTVQAAMQGTGLPMPSFDTMQLTPAPTNQNLPLLMQPAFQPTMTVQQGAAQYGLPTPTVPPTPQIVTRPTVSTVPRNLMEGGTLRGDVTYPGTVQQGVAQVGRPPSLSDFYGTSGITGVAPGVTVNNSGPLNGIPRPVELKPAAVQPIVQDPKNKPTYNPLGGF